MPWPFVSIKDIAQREKERDKFNKWYKKGISIERDFICCLKKSWQNLTSPKKHLTKINFNERELFSQR